MLERVPPSAECAAHVFLRRFEAPIRSHCNLGPSFWKHGNDNIDVPAWWPLYLNGVRNRTCTAAIDPNLRATTNYTRSIAPQHRIVSSTKCTARTFASSSPKVQSASVQTAFEDQLEQYDENVVLANTQEETIHASKIKPDRLTKSKSLDKSFNVKKGNKHLKESWSDFIRTGWKQQRASPLLYLLATGDSHDDLDNALRAFDLIPKSQRTAKDYYTAVDVSLRLERYSAAIQQIKEAVSKQLNQETFFKFLALCVSKSLWNTAADLWQQVGQCETEVLRAATYDPTSHRQNFAGRYTSLFDVVADLPSKLVMLANRLEINDPILAGRREDLIDLCQRLVLLAVESDKVMGIITGKGLLSLFEVQRKFPFNSNLHFAALATINRMTEKGTKSQLAMLIYKNLKFVHTRLFVPKWVFGTMIGISSAGKQPPKIYQSLLADYKAVYGVPEDAIYLQILKACANQGESEDVHLVFDDFCKGSSPKCADHINPLIRVHAVTGNYEKAQLQFDDIQTRFGFEPDVRNWNSLLLAYSRSSRSGQTYSKFKEMEQSGVRPDEYSWSILVAVAAKKGDTELAQRLVKKAKEAGVSPPLAMMGAVVDSCLLNGNTEEAWSLVIEATRASQHTRDTPVRLWNSIFRYYAFKADSEAILRTQEKMKQFGVKADGMTYAALMTALVVQGRSDDAAQILRTLHFSQALSANEFHYSILIHGFAMEKKHESALVVYREMIERFPRATPSANLSMLHLQAIRDEETARTRYLSGGANLKPDFQPTLESIRGHLANTKSSDLASTLPNPGFRRRSPRTDLDSIYLGSLITFLQRNKAYGSAQKVLHMLKEDKDRLTSSVANAEPSWASSIDTLSLELESLVGSEDWTTVSRVWDQLVGLTMIQCVPTNPEEHTSRQPQPALTNSRNIKLIGHVGSQFPDMVFQPFVEKTTVANAAKVIPAHKYILSRPLSQYFHALEKQQKHDEMVKTIQKLRGHGFSLSSKNWNGLIQALCRSSSLDHRTLAYELFERYLLPNAPSWDVIRRGKWVQPPREMPRHKWDIILKRRDDRKSRKALEKLDPGLLMPSYYTMVNLAIVWLKASQSASQGDYAIKRRLENQTPGTVKLVLRTPYLADRVQGILLRGRKVIGDRARRPRQVDASIPFAGVQGSQLLVDQIPADTLSDLQTIALSNKPITGMLKHTQELLGETENTNIMLPAKGRLETLLERRKRITRTNRHKLETFKRVLQQLREDSRTPAPLVGTMTRGQAPVEFRGPSPASTDVQSIHNHQQPEIFLKLGRVLRRVGGKALHKTSALALRNQKAPIRTEALMLRQLVQLKTSLTNDNILVASPHRQLKSRQASRRRLSANKSKQPRSVAKLRRSMPKAYQQIAKKYRIEYETLKSRVSTKVVLSKKLAKKLNQYKVIARRASKGRWRSHQASKN